MAELNPTESFIRSISLVNTGGNLINQVIVLKTGHIIRISAESVGIYLNEESDQIGNSIAMIDIHDPASQSEEPVTLNSYVVSMSLGYTIEAENAEKALGILNVNLQPPQGAIISRVDTVEKFIVSAEDPDGNEIELDCVI